MGRRRRDPQAAREEILNAAEGLLCREGPEALKLKRVAAEVGMSHPGVLHHFGSATGLSEALHERVSRRIREDVLAALQGSERREDVLLAAMGALADSRKGRLLAWSIATGGDPFPDAEERGLSVLAHALADEGDDLEEVRSLVLLVVLAMLGDSLVGRAARERMGFDDARSDEERALDFRRWLIERVRS